MASEDLKLGNQLCFRFYTVSRLIQQAYRPFLEPMGLTYPQYLVMLVLWESDDMPVNDIAKKLVLGTNTVTPLLKRMEEEGLITRQKDAEDERKVIVSLTERGEGLRKEAATVPCRMAERFAGCGKAGEMARLYPTLDSLIASMM